MSKVKSFNKGMAKGTLVKSELIEYENKKTKAKQKFLAMEVDTGDNNKVKAVVFPTQKNPMKPKEIFDQYPVGSRVDVSGSVQEKEFESKNGNKGIDRSLGAFSVKMLESDKTMAPFILQGLANKVKEVDGGFEVTIDVDNSYEKDGKTIEQSDSFTVFVPESLEDDMEDVVPKCGVKFKGQLLNRLEFDDYGDILGDTRMFQVEKIEDIVDPDVIAEMEEKPDFI